MKTTSEIIRPVIGLLRGNANTLEWDCNELQKYERLLEEMTNNASMTITFPDEKDFVVNFNSHPELKKNMIQVAKSEIKFLETKLGQDCTKMIKELTKYPEEE